MKKFNNFIKEEKNGDTIPLGDDIIYEFEFGDKEHIKKLIGIDDVKEYVIDLTEKKISLFMDIGDLNDFFDFDAEDYSIKMYNDYLSMDPPDESVENTEYVDYFNGDAMKTSKEINALFNLKYDEDDRFETLFELLGYTKLHTFVENIGYNIGYVLQSAKVLYANNVNIPFEFEFDGDDVEIIIDLKKLNEGGISNILSYLKQYGSEVVKIENFDDLYKVNENKKEQLYKDINDILISLKNKINDNKENILMSILTEQDWQLKKIFKCGGDFEKMIKSSEWQKNYILYTLDIYSNEYKKNNEEKQIERYKILRKIKIMNSDIENEFEELILVYDFNI